MGQKHSSSLAENEIDMMNRTELSSHFSNTISKSFQPDECIHCGARLEDDGLFNSNRKKSTADICAVRCRECRVCQSTNVILVKYRKVTTSPAGLFFRIRPAMSAESDPFAIDDNHNHLHDHVTAHGPHGAASSSV